MPSVKNRRPGFVRKMTREEINTCPLVSWTGPVSVIRTERELASAMRRITSEQLLGFDTETRPAYVRGQHYPPALLQLAAEDEVFLFQLQHLGLPPVLCELLADGDIIKAGVSLRYDIEELQKMTSFHERGFVDLGKLAGKAGIKNHGLRGLAAVLLGQRISKGSQTSNWARESLTPKQIRYAATDAWIGRRLYQELNNRLQE